MPESARTNNLLSSSEFLAKLIGLLQLPFTGRDWQVFPHLTVVSAAGHGVEPDIEIGGYPLEHADGGLAVESVCDEHHEGLALEPLTGQGLHSVLDSLELSRHVAPVHGRRSDYQVGLLVRPVYLLHIIFDYAVVGGG